MYRSSRTLAAALCLCTIPSPAHAQGSAHGPAGDDTAAVPIAVANDQRVAAGRMVSGELRIELEAVEAAWYPRGADGRRIVTHVFREVGRAPQLPGPLIRATAGTPIRVSIRNTLVQPIVVHGLVDRGSGPGEVASPRAPGQLPAFAFADSIVVRPGATGEARFTPSAAVSSFYSARVEPDDRGPADGGFMGAFVIDPAGATSPPDERVLMITRWWGSQRQGEQKMFLNGLAWPFTERFDYTAGDTVHWRVINASFLEHPMHLHGFHFTVDALGDTQADTIFAAPRPLAVTQVMAPFSAMRLTWVPQRPGNWLFHCHLIRHMGTQQRVGLEPANEHDHPDTGHADAMAGLITGITVRPRPDTSHGEHPPVRRIDLWTGERSGVFGDEPELGFVVQEGAVPPTRDSTRVPGSPLVLTRGEPTEIVVHNRLSIPLSVHWHGLELRSLYDGVGGWSGTPGAVRAPIAPGDSVRVLIAPPRAGTFMYHIHGEAGHELSQGLYGAFLVLEPDETRDVEGDRVFVLAGRGATDEPPPAINGRTRPPPERFEPGRTYRLRFMHISPDDFKQVRLLRDGEPVHWVPLARDGADLPPSMRVAVPASFGIGVGETRDVAWTPEAPGVYVLEVTTTPFLSGTIVQRIAFGVGDVAEAELLRVQEFEPGITLTAEQRARFVGTWVGNPVDDPSTELELTIRELDGRLVNSGVNVRGEETEGEPLDLVALAPDLLARATHIDGGLVRVDIGQYRLVQTPGQPDRIVFGFADAGGRDVAELVRTVPGVTQDTARGGAGPAPTLVIENARVIVSDGIVHERASVVIAGDRILEVTESAPEAPGARRIDAARRTVLPGLIDAHVHVLVRDLVSLPTSDEDLAAYVRDELPARLQAYLSAGVTTVASMGDFWPGMRAIRERIAAGELTGPRVLTAGPVLTSADGHPATTLCAGLMRPADNPWCRAHMAAVVTGATDATATVTRLAGEGVDFIKLVYDSIGPPAAGTLDSALVRAIVEATHARGLKAYAHISEVRKAIVALEAGLDGLVHVPYLMEQSDGSQALLDAVHRSGARVVATLVGPAALIEQFEQRGQAQLSAQFERQLQAMQRMAGFLGNADEDILVVGTDAPQLPAGAAYHDQLRLLAESGLTPARIIRAATNNAAHHLGRADELGTLEPGKLADLIMVEGNPLEDIGALRAVDLVVKGGEIVVGQATSDSTDAYRPGRQLRHTSAVIRPG